MGGKTKAKKNALATSVVEDAATRAIRQHRIFQENRRKREDEDAKIMGDYARRQAMAARAKELEDEAMAFYLAEQARLALEEEKRQREERRKNMSKFRYKLALRERARQGREWAAINVAAQLRGVHLNTYQHRFDDIVASITQKRQAELRRKKRREKRANAARIAEEARQRELAKKRAEEEQRRKDEERLKEELAAMSWWEREAYDALKKEEAERKRQQAIERGEDPDAPPTKAGAAAGAGAGEEGGFGEDGVPRRARTPRESDEDVGRRSLRRALTLRLDWTASPGRSGRLWSPSVGSPAATAGSAGGFGGADSSGRPETAFLSPITKMSAHDRRPSGSTTPKIPLLQTVPVPPPTPSLMRESLRRRAARKKSVHEQVVKAEPPKPRRLEVWVKDHVTADALTRAKATVRLTSNSEVLGIGEADDRGCCSVELPFTMIDLDIPALTVTAASLGYHKAARNHEWDEDEEVMRIYIALRVDTARAAMARRAGGGPGGSSRSLRRTGSGSGSRRSLLSPK